MSQTTLNTSPIFIANIVVGYCRLTTETSTPNPGSDNTPLLIEAGQMGSMVESIQIHYTNWGVAETVNSLFLYGELPNINERYCIGQITISANANTTQLPAPINVPLAPILYGSGKTAIKLSPGERLYVALQNAADSPGGFVIKAIGGDF